MKTRGILGIGMLAILVGSFALGCTGAINIVKQNSEQQDEEDENVEEDIYVGFFITKERIDSSFANDGRVYAKLDDEHFVFDKLDGFAFYFELTDTKYGVNVIGENIDESITELFFSIENKNSGGSSKISSGQRKSEISRFYCDDNNGNEYDDNAKCSYSELEGELLIFDDTNESIYYFYKVFETLDYKVYLDLNGSMGMHYLPQEGSAASQKCSQNVYKKENDKIIEETKTFVKITLKTISHTQSINIIEFDKDNKIICQNNYSPEEMVGFDYVSINNNAAYVIAEKYLIDKDNKVSIQREMFDKDKFNFLDIVAEGENNKCITRRVCLVWEEI